MNRQMLAVFSVILIFAFCLAVLFNGSVRIGPSWTKRPKIAHVRRVGSSLQVGRPKGCEAAFARGARPRAKRGNFFGYSFLYHPGSVLAGFQLSRHSAY